jgi:hypothetical protein
VIDRLRFLRGQGESFTDVILRIAAQKYEATMTAYQNCEVSEVCR